MLLPRLGVELPREVRERVQDEEHVGLVLRARESVPDQAPPAPVRVDVVMSELDLLGPARVRIDGDARYVAPVAGVLGQDERVLLGVESARRAARGT